jgi:two-component system chemotaxis response regulator CheY
LTEERQVGAFRRRLEAMGLDCRPVPGGRSLLVRLPTRGGPLAAGSHELAAGQFVFTTVGANRIKCLIPHPLFHLPLIAVADCESPGAIEARIRQVWRERQEQVAKARDWLEKLGCQVDTPPDTPVAWVRMGGSAAHEELAALEPGSVVLAGSGPLSGLVLERPEDRVFHTDADLDSAMDLELAVSTRCEELIRIHERLSRQERTRAMAAGPHAPSPVVRATQSHRVLLVGRRLLADTGLVESLRMRGYRVTAVRGPTEALRAFERHSFSLALVESELDRFEGIEMVPTVRALAGIEEMPLVLVDTRVRPDVRELARKVGASGYVTHPIDVPLIEDGLARLVEAPGRRRFTRYSKRFSVRAAGAARAEVAHQIGRGGMLLATTREVSPHALQRFAITLPDGAGNVQVDGEVVYRLRGGGAQAPQLGVRFERFGDEDERVLIAYLDALEQDS